MKWYIAQCPSGAESNAMRNLKDLLEKHRLEEEFGEYFVPHIQAKRSRRSVMANYIFIKINMSPKIEELINKVETMNLMKDASLQLVTYDDEYVDKMRGKITQRIEEDNVLRVGDAVIVCEAPFEGYSATIEEIDNQKETAKVAIPIFGRPISIELKFSAIKRIKETDESSSKR
jgi:transcriptional antiterminator NusG